MFPQSRAYVSRRTVIKPRHVSHWFAYNISGRIDKLAFTSSIAPTVADSDGLSQEALRAGQ